MLRRRLIKASLLAPLAGLPLLPGCSSGISGVRDRNGVAGRALARGIVWQPDDATIRPRGNWHLLGVDQLLVQWTQVDGVSLLPGETANPGRPDWSRIAQEPWASSIILGLAGCYDESLARHSVERLVHDSAAMARRALPFAVAGWYFPVEADPTWDAVGRFAHLLAGLPRPLWISAYDNSNIGPREFARWLAAWLPADVGVFFQDGVGLETREPRIARQYADQLARVLGAQRTRLIAEAFRPGAAGAEPRFRPAAVQELLPQLLAYQGMPTFIFDGPHYVSDALVDALRQAL